MPASCAPTDYLELNRLIERQQSRSEELKLRHMHDVAMVISQRDKIEKELQVNKWPTCCQRPPEKMRSWKLTHLGNPVQQEFRGMMCERTDLYRERLGALVYESDCALSVLKVRTDGGAMRDGDVFFAVKLTLDATCVQEQHRSLEEQYKTRIEKLEGRIEETRHTRKEVREGPTQGSG